MYESIFDVKKGMVGITILITCGKGLLILGNIQLCQRVLYAFSFEISDVLLSILMSNFKTDLFPLSTQLIESDNKKK